MEVFMKRIWMAAMAIVVTAPAAFPCQVIIDEERIPGRVRPLEITHRSFTVEAKVRDQVAEVVVTPVFRNPNPYAVEGTYFLSIPANAQVRDFTMKVGDKVVSAELLDAAKARAIYESIVRRRRDPALLELSGTRMLKASIFPIAPGAEVQVTVTYTALLPADGGVVSLELPFSNQFGGREPVPQVTVRASIESRAGIRAVYSPTHDVEIRRPDDRRAEVSYEARNYDARRAFRLHWSAAGGDIGAALLTWRKGTEDGYFAFLASPRMDLAAKPIPRDIVFVFDRSGSMAGEKMEQGREALRMGINMLADADRFGIVDFASEADSFRPELASASKENRALARDHVANLRAAGSTNINDALVKALDLLSPAAGRLPIVLFITDGLPTVGERRFDKILENARGRAARPRIFVFGVGADVNTEFLDRLAEEGRGARDYVAPEEKIEGKVSGLLEKIAHPVLADLAIDFGEAGARDFYPRALPELFRGGQLVLFGRYRGSGPAKITLKGNAGGEAREFAWDVHFPAEDSKNDSVPRLWAARKVAWLVDSIRLGQTAPGKEVIDEIVALGKRHGIVTPYTSFLITEEGEALTRGATDRLDFLKKDANASGGAATAPAKPADAPKAQEASEGLSRGREGKSSDDLDKAEKDARGRLGGRGVAVKRAADRTFYLRDGVWMDSTVEAKDLEGAIKIAFLSDEHFALAASDPDLAKCLSIGERVTVAWNGKIYRIVND
jgi:Ca-activated chloride channel family protein